MRPLRLRLQLLLEGGLVVKPTAGWSQWDLADYLGVDQAAVARFESGERPFPRHRRKRSPNEDLPPPNELLEQWTSLSDEELHEWIEPYEGRRGAYDKGARSVERSFH